MAEKTISIVAGADSYMDSQQPKLNWGNSSTLIVGTNLPNIFRMIVRFPIPKFNGIVKTQTLKLYITSITSAPDNFVTAQVYLVDSPLDDLWVEGSSIGVDDEGVCWDEYAEDALWGTPGGDFGDDPVGLIVLDKTGPVNQYYDIDIPVDNLVVQPEKSYSLIIKIPDETLAKQFVIDSRESANDPLLELGVEVDDTFNNGDPVIVTPISSTELKIDWERSDLHEDNFKQYTVEWSTTGAFAGEEATLTTITDQDITTASHTGLVVQGDVDDYDEDSDTYSNGRTIYYRVIVESIEMGDEISTVVDGATVPAMRPIKISSIIPANQYADELWSNSNVYLKPYGYKAFFDWYDASDVTAIEQIDFLRINTYLVTAGGGFSGSPHVDDITIQVEDDLLNGQFVHFTDGYVVQKVDGRIYDEGGLYRKFTDDKTTQQVDVTFPSSCPIALPSGPIATDPPKLLAGGPFPSGTITPIDLSLAGDQVGESIFVEDFIGTFTNKWFIDNTGSAQSTYSGADHILMEITGVGAYGTRIWKKMKKELDNVYNRYFDKYTGGYRLKLLFKFENVQYSKNLDFIITTSAWTQNSSSSDGGVWLRFQTQTGLAQFRAGDNLGTGGVRVIGNMTLSNPDNPLHTSIDGKYIYLELIASPRFFDPPSPATNKGMVYFVFWNIADTKEDAMDIDFTTLNAGRFYRFVDATIPVDEQPHYTGRCGLTLEASVDNDGADLEVYMFDIEGRVDALEYGVKNINLDLVHSLSSSPILQIPLTCSPDVASEVVLVEGRIRNSFGSQSRTDEIDGYQGDTFSNADPVAVLLLQSVGYTDSPIAANGSLSSDPEGGNLIYEWDWDDGSPIESSTNPVVYHSFSSIGTYDVKLRVQDEAGNWSAWVEKSIKIFDVDDIFIPVIFICPEPYTDMSLVREDGDTETPIHGEPSTYYQLNETGGRQFQLTGMTVECASLDQQTLIDNAKEEIDLLDNLYKTSQLVEITLPIYGPINGFITNFVPTIDDANPRFWTWTMVLKEIDEAQFGG